MQHESGKYVTVMGGIFFFHNGNNSSDRIRKFASWLYVLYGIGRPPRGLLILSQVIHMTLYSTLLLIAIIFPLSALVIVKFLMKQSAVQCQAQREQEA